MTRFEATDPEVAACSHWLSSFHDVVGEGYGTRRRAQGTADVFAAVHSHLEGAMELLVNTAQDAAARPPRAASVGAVGVHRLDQAPHMLGENHAMANGGPGPWQRQRGRGWDRKGTALR